MIESAILPGLLALIMFGVGLDVHAHPRGPEAANWRAVAVGLLGTGILLPAVGTAIAMAFDGDPALKIGLILLALSPVGLLAGPLAARTGQNVALAVMLTLTTSLLYLLLAPPLIVMLLRFAGAAAGHVSLPAHLMLGKIVMVTVLPSAAGALLTLRHPGEAARLSRQLGRMTTPALGVVLAWIVVDNRDVLLGAPTRLLVAILLIDVAAVVIATLLGRVFRLEARDRGALIFAHLMRQEGIGIFIAASLLAMPIAAVPLIANTVIGLLFCGLLWARRLSTGQHATGARRQAC